MESMEEVIDDLKGATKGQSATKTVERLAGAVQKIQKISRKVKLGDDLDEDFPIADPITQAKKLAALKKQRHLKTKELVELVSASINFTPADMGAQWVRLRLLLLKLPRKTRKAIEKGDLSTDRALKKMLS